MATIAPNTPSSPSPQGGSTVATNVPASRRRSGAFTNLQSYIQANRDTTREQAEKVAEDIEKRGQEGLQGIQSEAQRATQEVQNVGPQIEEADITSQIEEIAPNRQARQAGLTALTAPSTLDQSRVQQTTETIAQLRDANPNQVQFDFSSAANKAREAERQARMLGNTQGIQTLLGQDGPGATRGERRLDTLLLESIPEARQRFADVQRSIIGATDPALDEATASVRSAIDERQARLDALRQFADQELASNIASGYNLLEEYRPELAQQVQSRATQLGNQYNNALNAYLANAVPNQDFTSTLGQVDPRVFIAGAGRKTPEQLLLEAAGNPLQRVQDLTASELLDPETAARLNALYSLRGDLGQAGEDFEARQYTAAPTSIDDLMFQGQLPNINSRLQSEVTGATAAFNSQLESAANDYLSSIPNPTAANRGLQKILSNTPQSKDRVNEIGEIQNKLSALEQNLPQINQTLSRFGFGSVGGSLNEALRRFGYTGPLKNNPRDYLNLNDPDFQSPSSGSLGPQYIVNDNAKSLANALLKIDNVLGASAGGGNLPDVYIPPADTQPREPIQTNPDGSEDISRFRFSNLF